MADFDVLVVGGGYAGVLAALRASTRLGAGRVALVSREDSLVERTRLHEAALRDVSLRTKLAELLGPQVRRIVGSVEAVDGSSVTLADGAVWSARRVIWATGTRMIPAVPGAEMLETETVDRLRARLGTVPKDAKVAVIGGGLTGIELAGELAEAGHRTVLIAPRRLGADDLSERGAAACEAALEALGVERVIGRALSVRRGEQREEVQLEGHAPIPVALAIATVGMLPEGPRPLRPTLAAKDDPRLYLAGDCAARAVGVRMGCKTAMPLGAHAGDNAARSVLGEPERPFSWRYYGACVSIGRNAGVIDAQNAAGECTLLVTGRLGAWVKEQVLRYTLLSMHLERRGWFAYRWPEAKSAPALPAEAS